MTDHVLSQVEDRIVAVLSAWPALADKRIGVAESVELEAENYDILVGTAAYGFDVADENWMTIHTADIDIESVSRVQPTGTISRANRNVLGAVLGAIAADRSLGIGLQDTQEIDIASAEGRGKDVDASSIRFRVQWFTPRGDWFNIATS